jgi:HEAT repeat protein
VDPASDEEKLSAAIALGKIGPAAATAVPSLAAALNHFNGHVRRNATLALEVIGPAAISGNRLSSALVKMPTNMSARLQPRR